MRLNLTVLSLWIDPVSIHAPREGCDYNFPLDMARTVQVSIHAPREGCDIHETSAKPPLSVSIHAPREGCDSAPFACELPGARFQFTHPGRGATKKVYANVYIDDKFQFTHPGRGATNIRTYSYETSRCFNSRTPGGVRLIHVRFSPIVRSVSIHAPREGCDLGNAWMDFNPTSFNSRTPGGVRRSVRRRCCTPFRFQFTHPGRGATIGKPLPTTRLSVSIHAPREGCDTSEGLCVSPLSLFQFTHPGRGATIKKRKGVESDAVSIHAPREGCDVIAESIIK